MTKIVFSSKPIASRDALAKTLSLDAHTLAGFEDNIASYYNHFTRPKKNGEGVRFITAPKPALMQIQRRINSRIFSACVFPEYLHGSIRDRDCPRDFLSNATEHKAADTVITLDIRNFYPTITEREVFKVFKYLFRFSDEAAESLTALVTLNGTVPQGAPTSSFVANLIFYDKEPRLVSELVRSGASYTRLLDDITVSFSSRNSSEKLKQQVIGKIRSMCSEKGFQLHDGKQKIYSLRSSPNPALVTGVTIRHGRVGLSPEYRGRARAKVNRCEKLYQAGYRTSSEYHHLHNSTLGDVTLLKRLGYQAADVYLEKLRACPPVYSPKKAYKIRRACEDLTQRIQPATIRALARRYHVLSHCLNILQRTKPKQAKDLRRNLRAAFSRAQQNV